MARLIAVLALAFSSCSCMVHPVANLKDCKGNISCMKVHLLGKRLDKYLKLQGETKITVKRIYVHQ